MTALKDATKQSGSIEYLSIFTHANNMNLYLDNGQFSRESIGFQKHKGYNHTQGLDAIFNNPDIKFTPNALVVFAGCNSGHNNNLAKHDDNIAEFVTQKYGVATIGAFGYTSPQGPEQIRTADYGYMLNYIDENGVYQQHNLGKKLTDQAIEKAKGILNEVEKRKEEKRKEEEKDKSTPSTAPSESPPDSSNN